MCGLYGVLSYGNEIKDMAEITEALAVESAVRGTDATGIAYNKRGHMTVFKKSKSAYEMKFSVPKGVNAVMGHTRHATQGTLKYNANNHPFKGICGGKEFALAHNGILANDTALRRELRLPSTRIETDSYIAVQILESQKQLNFDSIKYMAEKVEGSYSFTILDSRNNLYIVKGDSPISLLHFPKNKVYVYASTMSILWKALVDTELFSDLKSGEYEEIHVADGEILKIYSSGQTQRDKFHFNEFASYGLDWRTGYCFSYDSKDEYIDDIKSVASYYGYNSEEIDCLLNNGFTPEEVEEMLYCNDCMEV